MFSSFARFAIIIVCIAALTNSAQPTGSAQGVSPARESAAATFEGASPQSPAFCVPVQPPKPTGTGRITGVVTAADGGQPIANTTVTAYLNSTAFTSTQTSSTGVYTLTSLATGSYKVLFNPPFNQNFLPEWHADKSTLFLADPVTVISGTTTSNINAVLATGAQIQGKVTAADSASPLPQVSVLLFASPGGLVGSATTDGAGNYAIRGIPTGNYKLLFDPRGAIDEVTSLYVSEYFDDKTDLQSASVVSITAPNIVNNINAALAKGAQIAGKVTAEDTGLPLEGVGVNVNSTTGAYSAYGLTDAQGLYTVTVKSGSYKIDFDPPGETAYVDEFYDNATTAAAATPVNAIAPALTPNINAALAKGGLITGRIVDKLTGKGLELAFADVFDASTGQFAGSAISDAAGYYTVTTGLRTGLYKVEFDRLDYHPRYFDDKPTFATADAVAVTAPNTTANINGALSACVPPNAVYAPIVQR